MLSNGSLAALLLLPQPLKGLILTAERPFKAIVRRLHQGLNPLKALGHEMELDQHFFFESFAHRTCLHWLSQWGCQACRRLRIAGGLLFDTSSGGGRSMNPLRDRWRRSALHQFWHGLDASDRATALLGIALAFAAALSIQAIARAWSADLDGPRFTAPPFELRFAEADR